MREDQPSAISTAWTSIITADPRANDVVRPWLEAIAVTSDPRRKRELIAFCFGASQVALILANEGETSSLMQTVRLVRSWMDRIKEDNDPFTVLEVSRWCYGASQVAQSLWLDKEHQLFSKIGTELFDLLLGAKLAEIGNEGGSRNA